jgi:hypothetical protein
MKKPIQKILLLIGSLFFLIAYKDFKKGFIDGFYEKNGKKMDVVIKKIKSGQYEDLYFPAIIVIY